MRNPKKVDLASVLEKKKITKHVATIAGSSAIIPKA
jgi:hypothetical protein